MGTWDVKPFANDPAMDLVAELEDLDGRSARRRRLDAALREALAAGADAPMMDEGVAAACLVASTCSPGLLSVDSDEFAVVRDLEGALSDLRPQALEVLQRAFVPTDNEWLDLREEAGATTAAADALQPFVRALGGHVTAASAPPKAIGERKRDKGAAPSPWRKLAAIFGRDRP